MHSQPAEPKLLLPIAVSTRIKGPLRTYFMAHTSSSPPCSSISSALFDGRIQRAALFDQFLQFVAKSAADLFDVPAAKLRERLSLGL